MNVLQLMVILEENQDQDGSFSWEKTDKTSAVLKSKFLKKIKYKLNNN